MLVEANSRLKRAASMKQPNRTSNCSGGVGWSVSTGFSAKDSAASTSISGLPLPRYVSLKSDHVNVRAGPTKDNDAAWVYTRSGLPIETTAEFENRRRVRDSEGAEG
jgi:SH3-like domain-containing protein